MGSLHLFAEISDLLIKALGCCGLKPCNNFMLITSPIQKKDVMESFEF